MDILKLKIFNKKKKNNTQPHQNFTGPYKKG